MAVDVHREVHQLAGLEDEDELAVTIYVDLDPGSTPTRADQTARVHALIDQLAKRRPESASLAAKQRFAAILEAVRDKLERVAGNVQGRGLAVLVPPDDAAILRWLPRSPGDSVHVGRRLALLPLAVQSSRTTRCLVLLAGREQGALFEVVGTRVREIFDDGVEAENRHDQGGWASAILQRWVDRAARLHLKEVVRHLERVHPRLGRPPVVVSASGDAVGALRDLLPGAMDDHIIAWLGDVHDWDGDRLIACIGETLAKVDADRERELLERVADQRGHERAPTDVPGLLAAASDGRIEWLLVWPGQQIDAARCPSCGRLSPTGWRCPFDGEPLSREPDGINALASAVLAGGGDSWQVDPGDDPSPQTPAAVVRY
jgi:Bacterial archaeo-eukaryotic release factor family 10